MFSRSLRRLLAKLVCLLACLLDAQQAHKQTNNDDGKTRKRLRTWEMGTNVSADCATIS